MFAKIVVAVMPVVISVKSLRPVQWCTVPRGQTCIVLLVLFGSPRLQLGDKPVVYHDAKQHGAKGWIMSNIPCLGKICILPCICLFFHELIAAIVFTCSYLVMYSVSHFSSSTVSHTSSCKSISDSKRWLDMATFD